MGNIVQFYGVHIPRKCIKSMDFYSCRSFPIKTPGRIFWNSLSPNTKRVEETMIRFIKVYNQKISRWPGTLSYFLKLFYFCMICNFFKCDGFKVLWTISIIGVVLSLLPFPCNHGDLTLKLYSYIRKNSYLNEGWLVIGRFCWSCFVKQSIPAVKHLLPCFIIQTVNFYSLSIFKKNASSGPWIKLPSFVFGYMSVGITFKYTNMTYIWLVTSPWFIWSFILNSISW